jgi:hypothetical protein
LTVVRDSLVQSDHVAAFEGQRFIGHTVVLL